VNGSVLWILDNEEFVRFLVPFSALQSTQKILNESGWKQIT
jgi:hypothetical protein